MAKTDKPDWNQRFEQPGCWCGEEPLDFLRQHIAELPRGRALDLAMGEGRNTVYLAQHGFRVTGIDSSAVGIGKALVRAREYGVRIEAIHASLETCRLPEEEYDLVVCSYYLQRTLFAQMKRALNRGGALIVETYTIEQLSRQRGPKSPDHLLRPNELYRAFRDCRISYYRETDDGHRAVASLLAFREGCSVE